MELKKVSQQLERERSKSKAMARKMMDTNDKSPGNILILILAYLLTGNLRAVWLDFAKFCNFGEIFNILKYFKGRRFRETARAKRRLTTSSGSVFQIQIFRQDAIK